ncbi:couple_hipB, transcriptional regulator, y4mF family [uncultured Caudovirales phage]|uniref:Couple_hipB, transcriptional regulator, y4mF family n=1 Tax=uncultured Caudovirales phage TaxID=2100421 RepID=A0A6J5LAS0_9CAUD|nr:couple_hipB, transcriptional regulator, y4mF family [uncultured Caudovirales phage]
MDEQQLTEARTKLAGFLKQKRKEKRITSQQLADEIGIMQPSLARIESGKFWVTMPILLKICVVLEIKMFEEL